MVNRDTTLMIILALVAELCLASGSAQAKGKKPPTPDALARGEFRDAETDAITSDGIFLPVACGGESGHAYVDREDPCYGAEDALDTVSKAWGEETYFLRPVTTNAQVPDRWLVFDFSDVLAGECLGLDTLLESYPGRDPGAVSYENPHPCVDLLEVRLFAKGVFEPSARETEVDIIIDGPDLVGGKGKNQHTEWSEKFYLEFLNPVTVTPVPGDPDVLTIGDDGYDDFRAELYSVNQQNGRREDLLGLYRMPFQLIVTRLPRE